MRKVGREKWGKKSMVRYKWSEISGAEESETRKVWREKWDDKSGARNVGEESGARILRKLWRQMWGEKSGARKVGR